MRDQTRDKKNWIACDSGGLEITVYRKITGDIVALS
jgi:hypothetical protein